MVLDSVNTHVEALRDAGYGKALAAQAYHLYLPRCEAKFLHAAGAFLCKVGDVGGDLIGHAAIILSKEFMAAGADCGVVRCGRISRPGTCQVL